MYKDLEVRETKLGMGVFANEIILKGDLVVEFTGPVLDYDEILDNSYEDGHTFQIESRTYLGPSGKIDDYINHSCNPNTGAKKIQNKYRLIAIRDIAKGEEISWDYSTWLDESHWQMTCRCRNENCRKVIGDFKYLPKEVKKRYIDLEIIADFIHV